MMNSQDLFRNLQNPQVNERFTKFRATLNAENQLSAAQAEKHALESQNAELVQKLKNMDIAMLELIAERDVLKGQQAASQTEKQGLETRNAELIRKFKAEREAIKLYGDATRDLQEQHAKELNDKNLKIQTLETQLAASQEESIMKKVMLLEQLTKEHHDKLLVMGDELQVVREQYVKQIEGMNLKLQMSDALLVARQKQHVQELNDKDMFIEELVSHLSAAEQQTVDKLKVLKEQHAKELNDKDLELQTLQEKLKAGQEQHAKELNEKDFAIQDLETRQSVAEQKTTDKIKEFTNQNNQHSRSIQMQGEQRLEGIYKEQESIRQKKKEVVTIQLHTEIGKLYMELQEAKKPQEALMAQLAVKDKEIECLREQLEAKDSEIQNLKENAKEGQGKLMAKDTELKSDRNGQLEK